MTDPPCAGSLYLIDRRDGRPAHWWIILCDPDHNYEFMAVSFTDATNFPAPDIWRAGTLICPEFRLAKNSVLHLGFIAVKTSDWLFDNDAQYIGHCLQDVLERARCNICWGREFLKPGQLAFFRNHEGDWDPPCYADEP